MSSKDLNYKNALEATTTICKEAVGFSSEGTSSTLVRQNNTIIELLIGLHKKLDTIISRKNPEYSKALEDLTSQISTLSLGDNSKSKNKTPVFTSKLLVWQDPKKQIEEYRQSQKKS